MTIEVEGKKYEINECTYAERRELHKLNAKTWWKGEMDVDAYYGVLERVSEIAGLGEDNIDDLTETQGIYGFKNLHVDTDPLPNTNTGIVHFGFDIEPIARTHYYEDRPKEWNDVHHNPSEEQKMLKRLRDANQIEIY